MNTILKEDIEEFTLPEDLIEAFRNSVVVVTGATGLIGSMFVRCIHSLRIGVRFILPVRNHAKAALMYDDMEDLSIAITDLNPEDLLKSDFNCDFIVHCASPTDGTYMSSHPVETFNTAVEYTKVLLEYCRNHLVKGMVYLSSSEYY